MQPDGSWGWNLQDGIIHISERYLESWARLGYWDAQVVLILSLHVVAGLFLLQIVFPAEEPDFLLGGSELLGV